MNPNEEHQPAADWDCGGWEGAERETLRAMQRLTLEQKAEWLEQAQRLVADLHGWEAALQPGGTVIKPRRQEKERSA